MRKGLKEKHNLRQRLDCLSAERREMLGKLLHEGVRTAPLSSAQQRFWFLEQLTPNSALFNVDLAIRLDLRAGDSLDVDAMRRALNEIVRRHESLRTSFSSADGQPLQVIHPELEIALPLVDLTGLPEAEREGEMMRMALEEAQRAFNLSEAPLLRGTLLRLRRDSFLFLLTVHHIVVDGWSLQIFSDELTRLYEAFRQGQPSPLPDLTIQYSDYVQWQRKSLQSEEIQRQLAYWKRRLGGVSALALPSDRPPLPVPSYRGARRFISVSQSLTRRLDALSRRAGTTLFVTLFTAIQTLFHRYTGQPEIVLGTPVVGRTRAETEGLIGCFINTLVMRTDLSGDPTFAEALQRAHETVVEALQSQDVPFEKIVEELNIPRDLSRNPLFQVTFQLLQTLGQAEHGSQPVVTQKGTTQLDLAIDLFQSQEGLSGTIEYSTDLFDHATIERLLGHFQVLLEGIVEDPDQRLSSLPVLTYPERRQLLTEWNAGSSSSSERPVLVHTLVEQQCAQTPDAVALISGDRQLTYVELDRESNRFARYLREIDVPRGALVALSLERSPEAVIAILGTLKAGCAFLPLDADLPAERLSFMLQDARPATVFTRERLADKWPQITQQSPVASPCELPAEACAYVIYTSGSTGTPKAVSIPHRAFSNHMRWWQEAFPLESTERMLHKYSLSFDVALLEIFGPLIAGAGVVIARAGAQADSAYLAELIAAHHVSAIDVVPSQLRALLDEPLFQACPTLRRITCGGETLPAELAQACLAALPAVELHNIYGPTEATISATAWKCAPEEMAHVAPIGKPILNTQVYVLDTHGNLVPAGVPGELHIGGVGLATGYLNHPDLTAEKFIPDPFSARAGARLYRTGDLVRYRSNGNLEHLGRLDDQVKVRGFRIELGEIEAALKRHPSVQACAAALNGSDRLAAYIVPAARPEIWPSVGEFFFYDPLLYHAMTHDERRNACYRAAIGRLVAGKTVVDIGTGADALLARFCIEAGARKVYAIEMLPESFKRAANLLAHLGLERRVHLLYGDATRVELPEKVDVCVSELLGMIASCEGVAVILNHARRFLKPGGIMIPQRSSTSIAAVSLPEVLAVDPRFTEVSGPYVERIFEQTGHAFDVRVCIDHFPKSHLLSDSAVFETLDFTSLVAPEFRSEIHLTMTRAGKLDGLLLWLNVETAPGERLDVLVDRTHWLPVFFPVFSPAVAVHAGDTISAVGSSTLSADGFTPDYRICGSLHQQSGRLDFDFVSRREGSEFQRNGFYRALFAQGYQERYVTPSTRVDTKALEGHLQRVLPEYMVPSAFVTISELPLTPNGKVDRRRLPSPAQPKSAETSLAPQTELERSIAAIWRDLLRVDSIGVDENFFDLGGHSLLAVQIVSRLRKQLNLIMPVAGVFQYPTIRLLANALRPGGGAN
jgi:amino acid adenylation domain-containing protein